MVSRKLKPTPPPTLLDTFKAALPLACGPGLQMMEGKSAQELYDSFDEIPWAERRPHWWLVQLSVYNLPKALETLVAWLQHVAAALEDGDVKEQINTLAFDADRPTLETAMRWVGARRKAGTTETGLEMAYCNVAQYLLNPTNPLDVVLAGKQIVAHRVAFEGVEVEQVYKETYEFLHSVVDLAAFNPGGLK